MFKHGTPETILEDLVRIHGTNTAEPFAYLIKRVGEAAARITELHGNLGVANARIDELELGDTRELIDELRAENERLKRDMELFTATVAGALAEQATETVTTSYDKPPPFDSWALKDPPVESPKTLPEGYDEEGT